MGFSIVDILQMFFFVVVLAVYPRETITNPARVNVYVVLSLETESVVNAWLMPRHMERLISAHMR